MKKIYLVFVSLLLAASVWAQAPQKMSYQAVIRNSSNVLLTSSSVGMQISILQGSSTGTAVYIETQTPITNANGLVSLEIGSGTPVTGTFAGINWATGPYFIKTETDPLGGTVYTIAGTNELMSVPYALFSANGTPGAVGATGNNGTNGTNGIDGATGATGANGANGLTGATGAAGANGTNGTNGIDGATGANGANGANGLTGATGAAGSTGATGAAGANGSNGATGLTGATGAAGLTGATGAAGSNGSNGAAGLTGATGAAGTNAGVGGFTHYLGEALYGGIIYYLYKGSDSLEHGLIVALTESTATWQTTYTTTNANRTEDGVYNMGLMTGSPAKTYITSLGAGWYLPSIDELGLLYYNRYSAQKGLRAGGHTLLSWADTYYWSSTEYEYDADYAYIFYFYGGYADTDGKGADYTVRGVRAF